MNSYATGDRSEVFRGIRIQVWSSEFCAV